MRCCVGACPSMTKTFPTCSRKSRAASTTCPATCLQGRETSSPACCLSTPCSVSPCRKSGPPAARLLPFAICAVDMCLHGAPLSCPSQPLDQVVEQKTRVCLAHIFGHKSNTVHASVTTNGCWLHSSKQSAAHASHCQVLMELPPSAMQLTFSCTAEKHSWLRAGSIPGSRCTCRATWQSYRRIQPPQLHSLTTTLYKRQLPWGLTVTMWLLHSGGASRTRSDTLLASRELYLSVSLQNNQ